MLNFILGIIFGVAIVVIIIFRDSYRIWKDLKEIENDLKELNILLKTYHNSKMNLGG